MLVSGPVLEVRDDLVDDLNCVAAGSSDLELEVEIEIVASTEFVYLQSRIHNFLIPIFFQDFDLSF